MLAAKIWILSLVYSLSPYSTTGRLATEHHTVPTVMMRVIDTVRIITKRVQYFTRKNNDKSL